MTNYRRTILISVSFAAVMALMITAMMSTRHFIPGRGDLQVVKYCGDYACLCHDKLGHIWVADEDFKCILEDQR
jgi:hypothetical protein